ncbi:MAG: hypothetical protein Q4G03_04040 [Planctomycetia bacterium]|nr:hypothetical protein [Planctomycetia bacterium]
MGKYKSLLASCVYLVFVVTLFTVNSNSVTAEDVSKFKKDALAYWTQRIETLDSFETIQTARRIDENGVIVQESSAHVFKMLYPCSSMNLIGEGYEWVNAYNSKYAFQLKRKVGDEDWEIVYLKQISNSLPRKNWKYIAPVQLSSTYHDLGLDVALEQITFDIKLFPPLPLAYLFTDPKFHITSVEKTEGGTGTPEEYRFDFKYDLNSDNNFMRIESGQITLNANDYSIRSATLIHPAGEGAFVKYQIEYDSNESPYQSDETRTVTRSMHSFDNDKFRSHEEQVFVFTAQSDLSEEYFTLSHYGFPEPVFKDVPPSNGRLVFLFVGVLLLLTALGVSLRKGKRAQNE